MCSRAAGRTRTRRWALTGGRRAARSCTNRKFGSRSVNIGNIAYVDGLQSVATTGHDLSIGRIKKKDIELIYPTGTIGSVRVSSWGAGSTLFAIPNELWKTWLMRKKDHVSLRLFQRIIIDNLRKIYTRVTRGRSPPKGNRSSRSWVFRDLQGEGRNQGSDGNCNEAQAAADNNVEIKLVCNPLNPKTHLSLPNIFVKQDEQPMNSF